MTPQQIFDITAAFLLGQGRPSMGPEGCLYNGPDGAKCAAGLWMKTPAKEGQSLSANGETQKALHPSARENLRLMKSLQSAHDSASVDESVWLPRLKIYLAEIANEYSLNPAVLELYP
jgi:hypothetical protein